MEECHEESQHVRLNAVLKYRRRAGRVEWEGRAVPDVKRFKRYMRHVVGPRLAADDSEIADVLRGLASTKMATEGAEGLLNSVPRVESWQVGEAVAECALGSDIGWKVHWPWRTSRDCRTPGASVPGADLVGFVQRGDDTLLLFGEVKTSGQARTPPTVMTGPSGLPRQLEKIALRPDVQYALLKWLMVRCQSQFQRNLFEKAASRYINSGGRSFMLIGVLLRDTTPDERDLRRPAEALSRRLATAPASVDLVAWYLPIPIDRWPTLAEVPA